MLASGICFRSNSLFLFYALLSLVAASAFTPSHRSRRISDLVLRSSSSALPDGIVKQVSTPGSGKSVSLGDIATVRYSCYVSGKKDALPVARADRQKMVCDKEVAILFVFCFSLHLFCTIRLSAMVP